MSRRPTRLAAALAASAALPGLLAGCVPAGPSLAEAREQLRAAVAEVEGVDGALVTLSSAGADALGIRLQLYVDPPGALPDVVDGALQAAWRAAPREPDRISLSAVLGPMPEDAIIGSLDGVDLAPVVEALGIPETEASADVVLVPGHVLAARYGAWTGRGDG